MSPLGTVPMVVAILKPQIPKENTGLGLLYSAFFFLIAYW